MEKSESIKNIAIALCHFSSLVEKIKKTETNPFFKSKYADLSGILDVIKEPLIECELSIVQFPKGKYGLETMIMHSSGEWMSGEYEMKPTKEDPQNAGSVITYQRRYALGAILGLNIDKDDDGNAGSEPVKEPAKEPVKKQITKEALTPIHPAWIKVIEYLKGTGTMSEVLKKYTISKEFEAKLIEETLKVIE
jgi:hypothetical protein